MYGNILSQTWIYSSGCQSLGSRPTQAQELFYSCAPSLWNNLTLSVYSASSVTTFKIHLKTSLWIGLCAIDTPHTRWPVDITELLHQFCCWTPIWLSCHWAWLCWGYWCCRNLIVCWNRRRKLTLWAISNIKPSIYFFRYLVHHVKEEAGNLL